MSTTKMWLLAAVASVVIEVLPPPTHFAFLAIAFGALAAAIVSVYFSAGWLAWMAFVIVSIALMPMLIPLARFLFTPRPHASNVDAIVGQRAIVTEPIDATTSGMVKVHGEVWRAVSEGEPFKKEEWVIIDRVEGTHVIIRRPS